MRDWVLTVMIWLSYGWLIRDLVLLPLELAGVAVPGLTRLADRPFVLDLAAAVGIYGLVAMANGSILLSWALYNQVRFRGRERRSRIQEVEPGDLAKFYACSAHDIVAWQAARSLEIDHEKTGELLRVVDRSAAVAETLTGV